MIAKQFYFQMSVHKIGDCRYLVKSESKLGTMEMDETFSEDGLRVIYNSEKAGKYEIFFQREFKEQGWFKYVKGEDLKPFMIAQGINMMIIS